MNDFNVNSKLISIVRNYQVWNYLIKNFENSTTKESFRIKQFQLNCF